MFVDYGLFRRGRSMAEGNSPAFNGFWYDFLLDPMYGF